MSTRTTSTRQCEGQFGDRRSETGMTPPRTTAWTGRGEEGTVVVLDGSTSRAGRGGPVGARLA
jgi:hypothetical protein